MNPPQVYMCLTALEAEVHDQDVGGVGCPGDSVGESFLVFPDFRCCWCLWACSHVSHLCPLLHVASSSLCVTLL